MLIAPWRAYSKDNQIYVTYDGYIITVGTKHGGNDSSRLGGLIQVELENDSTELVYRIKTFNLRIRVI